MPVLLEERELRKRLEIKYSSTSVLQESRVKRKFNIESFLDIPRNDLSYGEKEARLLLYTTLQNEKIYIQYPGKESMDRNNPKPMDFRPKFQLENGMFLPDANFGNIWDILDDIGKRHKDYLSIIAAIFIRIGYMFDYRLVDDIYKSVIVDSDGKEIGYGDSVGLKWYAIDIDEDVWFTLNDHIGKIEIYNEVTISFEAFIKFVDLLFQNEDCKYYYINSVIKHNSRYALQNGRNSSSDTNLAILYYLQGKKKLSALLNEIQKGRGVANFRKSDYMMVTNGIVTNIDLNN